MERSNFPGKLLPREGASLEAAFAPVGAIWIFEEHILQSNILIDICTLYLLFQTEILNGIGSTNRQIALVCVAAVIALGFVYFHMRH